jgi:hypothetical protein
MSDACGYDKEDCEDIDLLAKVGCNVSQIGDGICNPQCNNSIGLFDLGDCNSPCGLEGGNELTLGQACDSVNDRASCNYDNGS